MSDRVKVALEIIQRQIQELDATLSRGSRDLNVVMAGERLGKWKARTARLIADHVGPNEAGRFGGKRFERAFYHGDLDDELDEEIEMYRAHLVSLAETIKSQGSDALR